MVLAFLFFMTLFGAIENDSNDLLDKYEDQVSKSLKKQDVLFNREELKSIYFTKGEYYSLNKNGKEIMIFLAEVASCNLGGCTADDAAAQTLSSEYFDLLVVLDSEEKIIDIEILTYFSDYGYEVTSKRYLKKFIKKSVCDFSNETDGIDGISGATISSSALEGMLGLLCSSN